jgi:hypothetical protein
MKALPRSRLSIDISAKLFRLSEFLIGAITASKTLKKLSVTRCN